MADNWLDTLLNGLGGLGEKAISSAGLIALAKYLQDQADKGAVKLPEAKRELAEKSAGYETAMKTAAAPAADVTAMRTALQNRAYNSPLKPLSVNPPGAFNPYAPTPGNPNPTMGGPVSPTMLAKVQSLAQNRNATTQWGGNALQTQLSQRMGTRDMRIGNKSGALTPLPLREHPVAEKGMNSSLAALQNANLLGNYTPPPVVPVTDIGTPSFAPNPALPGGVDNPPGINDSNLTSLSAPAVGTKRVNPGTSQNEVWNGTAWVADTGTNNQWLQNFNPPDKTQFDLAGFLKMLQGMQGGQA